MPWKEINVMNQKLEFIMKAFSEHINFQRLCREYGISTKTGYKWKQRFLEEGIQGLHEKSRKPQGNSKQIPEEVICEIIKIKQSKKNWGPKKIRAVYAGIHPNEKVPSQSTFERILKKAGFVEPQKRRRIKSKAERIQERIDPVKPNDVWTVDFKGWWYTQEKEKCEPLTVRDEYSKYILSIQVLEKGNTTNVKREFERLFKKYGLPKMIRSDNGPPFASHQSALGLTRLAVWWMANGIRLDRIDPGSPYQNGAHERMHLDMKKELEGKISGSLKMHQSIFDVWRKEFNNERPHEGLDMKTPSLIYKKSSRKYEGPIDYIEYPAGFLSRQLNSRGYFQYKGHRVFISNAFNAYNIGLKPNGSSNMEVWFNKTLIGEMDLQLYIFKSILEMKKDECNNKLLPMS